MTDDKTMQPTADLVARAEAAPKSPTVSPEVAMLTATAPELSEEVMPPNVEVEEPAGQRPGVAPEIWVVGLIGVIVILLVIFSVVL